MRGLHNSEVAKNWTWDLLMTNPAF